MAKDFYKIQKGVSIAPRTAPSDPADGDIWYDSVLGKFRKRQNGVTSDFGSGGSASEVLERMKDWLRDSPFNLLSYNIIADTFLTEINSTTGTNNLSNGSVEFSSAGQNLISKQLLDPSFLADGKNIQQADVSLFYLAGSVDPAPVVAISRDGGTNFTPVTVSRIGTSDTFRGLGTFVDETVFDLFDTYAVANADIVAPFVSAASSAARGQIYVAAATQRIRRVTAYMSKTGSPIGYVKVQIVKAAGSVPSLLPTDVMGESAWIDISTLAAGNSTLQFPVDCVIPAGNYFMYFQTDAIYKANQAYPTTNYLGLRVDNSAPTKPAMYTLDGTTWSVHTAAVCYIVEGGTLDLRVKVTASAASQILSYGALYDQTAVNRGALKKREVQTIVGGTNPTMLTISNFVPDPDLVRVYVRETGQVFVNGAFTVSGRVLTFPINTFNTPDTLTVAIQQIGDEGSAGIDNTDSNAQLLAANFLGAADATLDRSVAGRGILLRSPDGTLYEITIRNGGTGFDIYQVT